jgi:hypothetical protein
MPDQEYARFKELAATIQNFVMPRRCAACRKIRRTQQQAVKTAPVKGYSPSVLAALPKSAAVVTASPVATAVPTRLAPVEAAPKSVEPGNEVLFVLATKDFDDLVHGRPVVWKGVKVVLADIGFDVMRKAIDEAEVERAKKLVRANGH